MQCELCGKEAELYRAKIEGTVLNVCKRCAAFGEIISKVKPKPMIKQPKKREEQKEELIETVVSNFAELVRRKRESLGLKQEELAKEINEKESIIHKIETGSFVPTIKLARKLEHFLGVKLVIEEKLTTELASHKPSSDEGLTFGDAIKLKKR